MDSLILALQKLTSRLAANIVTVTTEDILNFIDKREKIINSLKAADLSPEEREKYRGIVEEILQHDQMIVDKMAELRNEAQAAIHKFKSASVQKSAYDTAYSPDSVFFDKRK
jgi:hypothetical protein